MTTTTPPSLRALLLTRSGLAFLDATHPAAPPQPSSRAGETSGARLVDGVEMELAAIGYAVSTRLRARLEVATGDELSGFLTFARTALLASVGGERAHRPLFTRFPDGVPSDTRAFYWQRVLVHFLQAENQPCIHCARAGTTHVLSPCAHVVCDHCFDPNDFSGCPVCGSKLDAGSPYVREAPVRDVPKERVRFKLLDLGGDLDDAARRLFAGLCARTQALSPDDRLALSAIVHARGTRVIGWLPDTIPVRENVAAVFGALFRLCPPADVLPHARRYLKTATDVLRLVAVWSGADGALQGETIYQSVPIENPHARFWDKVAAMLKVLPRHPRMTVVSVPVRVRRFKVAKIARPVRRALLSLLDAMPGDRLTEDMLRHRSYWVWLGEFLHPHEYASRFPNVARAFEVVRKKRPDGSRPPAFRTWNGTVERAVIARDVPALVATLKERPGELARRVDHLLRLAGGDAGATASVASAVIECLPKFATPVVLTLRSHLASRSASAVGRSKTRVYWPKGKVALGVSAPETRDPLADADVRPLQDALARELLARFAAKAPFEAALIDASLASITVPFNERTAASSAVALPRGSRIRTPDEKLLRLFVHWCETPKGRRSDVDLSIGFYDAHWQYLAVCSYYALQWAEDANAPIARSSGDFTSAPYPDGASEFVDLYTDRARDAGARYAVMVVNNYSGAPFALLERGYAGLMPRDDAHGEVFDPRKVELKFTLHGDNGIYVPLVLDLEEHVLHWLDVQNKGEFAFNNVDTSNAAITKVCPELIGYFESGARPTMLDLALLHAAARCRRVFLRKPDGVSLYVRRADEDAHAFYTRLRGAKADEPHALPPPHSGAPLLAVLLRGDVAVPEKSEVFVVFRDQLVPTLAASDLLA
jgi:hypothetical protein